MRAIIELKLVKQMENLVNWESEPTTYETVIDTILAENGYELNDVSVFYSHSEEYNDLQLVQANNGTLISAVVELEEIQIKDFKLFEQVIIGKVLDFLGDKYLNLLNKN